MSRYGTVLGGTANARTAVVQSANADDMIPLIIATVAPLLVGIDDPVATSLTLTGAGDGHMFFLEIEGAASANVDGGARITGAQFFVASDAATLQAQLASMQFSQPIFDVQIAGSAKGQRVMAMVLFGTVAGGGGANPCTSNALVITGLYACAENDSNTASGRASFAIGSENLSAGNAAFASGLSTVASGDMATTSGQNTLAASALADAQGFDTSALGTASHAEGDTTQANGDKSHAEGDTTLAGNPKQNFTVAPGGITVTISGDVRGQFTNGDLVAIQPTTPANTVAQPRLVASVPAFAAGNTTFDLNAPIDPTTTAGIIVDTAIGVAAHAEGLGTVASGHAAHAEGFGIMGFGPQAISDGAHAEGIATCLAAEFGAHAEGAQSFAFGLAAHAEGFQTQAAGTEAHAEGDGTSASGVSSHAEGSGSSAGNPIRAFSIPAGGITVTIVGDSTSEFTNGGPVVILPIAPAIKAADGTHTVATVPAFAAGNTTFDLDAPIDATTIFGRIVDPSFGNSAHAEGNGTVATGLAAHATGRGGFATGDASTTMGENCTASGRGSVAHGNTGVASRDFQYTHGGLAGNFAGNAANQFGRVVFGFQEVAPGSVTYAFPLDANRVYGMTLTIVATDGLTPTTYTQITKKILIATDGAANPTVAFDAVVAALTQTVGGITVAETTSPAIGHVNFDFVNGTPLTNIAITCTLEWTEVNGEAH